MKFPLSISNIAWEIEHDDAVALLLKSMGVDCIDVAPGKYFKDFAATTTSEIEMIKTQWLDRGLSIIGIQSLLYGTRDLNLFSDHETQKMMLNHLQHICRIGAGLGATKLVFGSPKNRDRSFLSDVEAQDIARNFFWNLGNIAQIEGVVICLEANPSCYGANFLTSTLETFHFVRAVKHPAIKMQLDTGTMFINQENPSIVEAIKDCVGHVHISEPQLVPLGTMDHGMLATTINKHIPIVRTIEMLTSNVDFIEQIKNSVMLVQQHYGEVA